MFLSTEPVSFRYTIEKNHDMYNSVMLLQSVDNIKIVRSVSFFFCNEREYYVMPTCE